MADKRKSPKVFYAQLVVMLVVMWMAGTYIGNRFHLGIDDQSEPCLPYKFYLIDRGDKNLERNQFVAFLTDDRISRWFKTGSQFTKEVKAMAGDRVRIAEDGAVYINGSKTGQLEQRILEKIQKKAPELQRDVEIPKGKFFVMGRAPSSFDSRYWGLVDQAQIVGTVYPLF